MDTNQPPSEEPSEFSTTHYSVESTPRGG